MTSNNSKRFCRGLSFFLLFLVSQLPGAGAALDVALSVENREGSAKSAEPITSGVPFAQGALADNSAVRLLEGANEVPAQFQVTARWPDGSVRWLLLDFQTDLAAASTKSFTLQTGVAAQAVSGIAVTDSGSSYELQTGAAGFTLNKSEFALRSRYFEVGCGGAAYRAVPDPASWSIEEQGPLKTVLRVEGRWYNGGTMLRDERIGFRARLVFYRNKSIVRAYLTFRNNNSFGFDAEVGPAQPTLTLSRADFGIALLPPGSYSFASGMEKTWEVLVDSGGAVQLLDSRYLGNGMLDPRFTAPRLLTVAQPAYYSSTGAWGKIALTPAVSDSALAADFARYEKLQRAKVRTADLEDPPNVPGITLWQHLYQDIDNWNHYGGLRWGGDFGPVSDNHYDWIYGMYLQFMRTGLLPFADAARVFAKHELDFAIYHSAADGPAFNYQKNWESRPSNDSPGNDFGPGRPSHTWIQGYILHWLLTGDPRGKDGYQELQEGIRQYVYESFNENGYIGTRELRFSGWLTENLVALYRVNPNATLTTTNWGTKSLPQAIKDVLKSVFDYEAADGGGGHVTEEQRSYPLQNCYFLEPAIEAYNEVFIGRDADYAANLLALITRMTNWLMSITYGGSSQGGEYLPHQIPYAVRAGQTPNEGYIPYLLMAANAAGFLYSATGQESYLSYARSSFQDYIRYMGAVPGDRTTDPAARTPTSYNSSVFTDTESKIHGWSSRYGQYYLAAENGTAVTPDTTPPAVRISSPRKNASVKPGVRVRGTASDNVSLARVEYRVDRGAWSSAVGTANWAAAVSRRIKHRKITFYVRATDLAGNTSAAVKRKFSVR